jgi:photosystem II stability/assembly factor-like uncharacterized protein
MSHDFTNSRFRSLHHWRKACHGLCLAPLVFLSACGPQGIQGTNWLPIGPAPIDGFFAGGASGRASAIAANPFNADEIFLGTAAGGVWHTRDAGVNWEPISSDEAALAIGAIAVDDCSTRGCETIYAGTGENALRRDTFLGAGLLVGTAQGGPFPSYQWSLKTGSPLDFRGGSINDIVLVEQPSGPPNLFITLSSGVTVAAAEDTITAPAPASGYGIYRSDDGGNSWTKLTVTESAGARPTDLELHPVNDQIMYAGFLGRGVFKTTDGGATWCPRNEGIPKPPGCPNSNGLPDISLPFDFVEVDIFRDDPKVVYASFGRCADGLIQNCVPGVYKTSNNGNSWSEQNPGDPANGNPEAYGYSRYTHALAVHPTQEDTLFLGGVSLWKSTDGGQTFNTSDNSLAPAVAGEAGVIHSDHREMRFHPTSSSIAYDTSDGGFAISTDGGNNWTPRNDDLQITGFHGLGSSPLTGAVIGTSQDNGGQLWTGSRVWDWLNCCGDGGFSFMDWDDAMKLYAASNFGSLKRSDDGGASFIPINTGIDATDQRLFYAPFIQDPSTPHPLYFGTTRLYKSTNDGGLWTALSPVLATGAAPEIVTAPDWATQTAGNVGVNVITAIAVAPSNPARVYVGYYGGQVFFTNGACDMPACWDDISSGLPGGSISAIAVHSTQPDTAYVTISGFGAVSRIWRTTTAGASWNPIDSGLPAGIPANAIAVEPSTPSHLWLGLDSGSGGTSMFKSTNGGNSWAPFGSGLPNAPVFQISIDETHGRVYAATHGRGAYVLGKPFISNFEGWVDDSIWDVPVYGQNFTGDHSCTMQLLQSTGDVCAESNIDVMNGTMETDGAGVLTTSLGGMWGGKPVVWACYNGSCIDGTPIADCNDDEDGDGDDDPLSTIIVSCNGELASTTILGCPTLDNPPSTLAALNLAGFMGAGESAGGGAEAAMGEMPETEMAPAQRLMHLSATVQSRKHARSLCTVAVPIEAGEDEAKVLGRAAELINTSQTCRENGVEAQLVQSQMGSEDEFPVPPRLRLSTTDTKGNQVITALESGPGEGTGSCFAVRGLGVPILGQLQIPKLWLTTPEDGSQGGLLQITQQTSLGTCRLALDIGKGLRPEELAKTVFEAVQARGIPGPHPDCPSWKNPRDISVHGDALVTVASKSVEICTTDPGIGFRLRSEELPNVHPVAGAVALDEESHILLDASGSSDPDSSPGVEDDIASYEWFAVSGQDQKIIGEGLQLKLPADSGVERVRLKVTDRGGLSDVIELEL